MIEDCAQCFGGVYKGKKVGTIGTVGCFSFCQSKHFTTGGEGGMVCCNDDDLAWEIRSVRDHGYDVKAKLNLLQMVDRGALTPNEWRRAFNLAPVDGGDKPIRRLDTQPVNQNTTQKGDETT